MVYTYVQKIILLITVFLSCANITHAELKLRLAEPQWTFILQNQPLAATEAGLQPGERGFAQKIQPLLAEQNYEKVFEVFRNRPLAGDSPALRLLRGQVLLSLKKYTDAEQALKAALQSMPDLALAHRSLSMVYMLQKNYSAARGHLIRSVELGVADAQVYGQLAFVNLQTANAASAIAGYQQALFLDPENGQWQQGLLYALMSSGAMDQARALVEQMLLEDGSNAEFWLLRSQIFLQQQRARDALYSLEVALRLGETSPDNQAMAAQLHLQHGSIARAVDLLTNNIKHLNKRNAESLLSTIEQVAAWLAYRQDWRALSRLLVATEAKKIPKHYHARLNIYRAQQSLRNGQTKKAQEWLTQSLTIDPTLGEALLTLADLHRSQNQSDQAIIYYVRAQALAGYQERALLGRAQLEIDRQSYREGLRLLRQVMQLNPNRDDIAINIRSLEMLIRNQG